MWQAFWEPRLSFQSADIYGYMTRHDKQARSSANSDANSAYMSNMIISVWLGVERHLARSTVERRLAFAAPVVCLSRTLSLSSYIS